MDTPIREKHTPDNLSALAWVYEELRKTLDSAHKALRRFLKESAASGESADVDAVDTAILRTARVSIHQGVGALELVGLPEAATVLRASEGAVQKLVAKPALANAEAVGAIELASFALLDYLGRRLAGKPVSALSMFPQYESVQKLAGAERVHPADLWPQDWRWKRVAVEASERPRVADARTNAEFEQKMLAVMRGPDARGFAAASDLCAGLAAGTAHLHTATLWSLAAAVFEAQSTGVLEPDVFTKRVASRLLSQLRMLQRGDAEVSDRLAQDLLFFCAQARQPHAGVAMPRLRAVQQAYSLQWLEPEVADYRQTVLGRHDPSVISQARKRVAAAKDSWSAVAAGELHRLDALVEQFSLVGDSLKRLLPAGEALAAELQVAAVNCMRGAHAPSPALAMEVATAFLYLEALLEESDLDSVAKAERTETLALRIRTVAEGHMAPPLDHWMEELYRGVSDRQTMGSVVQELRVSLGEAEKRLDQFHRQPAQREPLFDVPRQLAAMRGVMSVLGIDAAVDALARMRDDVEGLALAEGDAAELPRSVAFERLATNMGALGFLIDLLSVQPQAAKSLFTFSPEQGILSTVMGRATEPELQAQLEGPDSDWMPEDAQAEGLAPISEPVAVVASTQQAAPSGAEPPAQGAETPNGLDLTPAPEADSAPLPPVATQAITPAPVVVAGSELEDDAEMREIFLEEAQEVITEGLRLAAVLRREPQQLEQLTALRRSFHTLKGSSRMVGLREFGEGAWACEQVFNQHLAAQLPADDLLLELSDWAMNHLKAWTEDLARAQGRERRAAPVQEKVAQYRAAREAGVSAAAQPSLPETQASVAAFASNQPPSSPNPPSLQSLQSDVEPLPFAGLSLELDAPQAPEADAPQAPEADAPQAPEAAAEPTDLLLAFPGEIAEEILMDLPSDVSGDVSGDISSELATEPLPLPEPLLAFEPEAMADTEPAGFDTLGLPEVTEEAASVLSLDLNLTGGAEFSRPDQPLAESGLTLDLSFDAPENVAEPASEPQPLALDLSLPELNPGAEPVAPAEAEPLALHAPELAATLEMPPDLALEAPAHGALAELQAHEATPLSEAQEFAQPAELSGLPELVDETNVDLPLAQSLALEPEGSLEWQGVEPAPQAQEALPEPAVALELGIEALASGLSAPGAEPDLQAPANEGWAQVAPAQSPEDFAPTEATPAPSSAEAFEDLDDQIKVVGHLRIGIPLFNIYLSEADEVSRRLHTALAEWAAEGRSDLHEAVPAMAHSLGGSSAAVGFEELAHYAKLLETVLTQDQQLRASDTAARQLLVQVSDDIRRVLHQFAAGFLKPPRPELLAALQALEHSWSERLHEWVQARALGLDTGVSALDELAPALLQAEQAPGEQALASLDGAAQAEPLAPGMARAEPAAEPAAGPAPEPIPELIPEPLVERAAESAVAAPAELATEPDTEQVTQPATEPAVASVHMVAAVAVSGGAALKALDDLPMEGARKTYAMAQEVDDELEEDLDVEDAVDAELFPIFEEEAQELLPQISEALRAWMAEPAQSELGSACMRSLHTLKGGARLAGAMRVGELAHRLESAIEAVMAKAMPEPGDLDGVQHQADAMVHAFDVLRAHDAQRYAQAQPAFAAATAKAEAAESEAPSAHAGLPTPSDWAAQPEQSPVPTPGPQRLDEPLGAVLDQGAAERALQAQAPQLATAGDAQADAQADAGGAQAPDDATLASTVSATAAAESSEAQAPQPERAALAPAGAPLDWSRFKGGSSVARQTGAEKPSSQSSVRVRSPLLDRMVNQAGEVSITRSRIESEVTQIRSAMGELSDNLERLRMQLRDIDLQAETQMSSRLEAAKAADQAFDPLEFDRFTRFQELTRMMAESVNDVGTLQRALNRTLENAEDALVAQARLTRDLQQDLLRTRMVEFEGLSDRLYRVVRQAAKETGKQVRLDIIGGSIEVDRGVLDRMTPAFEHLLRNCITHGIEPAGVRAAAGKDPVGTITVALSHEGNEVGIAFGDDGAGLNLPRIREKAQALGLLGPDAQPTDAELADFIFSSGFSTADKVTELAGRGVGMDVVRSEVTAIGGRIETATSPGRGTRFTMQLPLTTAVTQVVMLRMDQKLVAVPSNLIEIVRRAKPQEVEACYASGSYAFGEAVLPFYWMGALLQWSPRSVETSHRTRHVVVIRSANQRVVVHVDEVLGNQEVVVKSLGPQLARLPGLTGMTLLASGGVALIYNPVALAAVYGESARSYTLASLQAPEIQETPKLVEEAKAVSAAPLVLVVDDSLTVRRVTQRLLAREGYRVVLAKDGLEALEKLAQERPKVVLSDIEMPRMDGFDLVRNIRGDARLADLPVIMITSRIAEKHREHAAELGVNHYLGKPYSEDDLLALVARYTGESVEA
jgi:chemosensory pili system protein ChpA (sensor histidine kinase/response regulator)